MQRRSSLLAEAVGQRRRLAVGVAEAARERVGVDGGDGDGRLLELVAHVIELGANDVVADEHALVRRRHAASDDDESRGELLFRVLNGLVAREEDRVHARRRHAQQHAQARRRRAGEAGAREARRRASVRQTSEAPRRS